MATLLRPSAMSASTSRSRVERVETGSSSPASPAGPPPPGDPAPSRRRRPAAAAARNSSTSSTRSLSSQPNPPRVTRLTACRVSTCWESTSTPRSGCGVLDLTRRPGALVGEGRRHPDVEHDEVRRVLTDDRSSRRRRGSAATTRCPRSTNSRTSPSRSSDLVLGDHDAHGSRTVGGSAPAALQLQAAAQRRDPVGQSAEPRARRGAAPPTPSS